MWGREGVSVALCSGDAGALTKLPSVPSPVSILGLHADSAGDIKAAQLRAKCKCRLLYSLRSTALGGESSNSDHIRQARLIAAARECDLIELEVERDLVPHVLGAIEPARRLVSWRGAAADAASLRAMFVEMTQ